jgi:hypothetical protein
MAFDVIPNAPSTSEPAATGCLDKVAIFPSLSIIFPVITGPSSFS